MFNPVDLESCHFIEIDLAPMRRKVYLLSELLLPVDHLFLLFTEITKRIEKLLSETFLLWGFYLFAIIRQHNVAVTVDVVTGRPQTAMKVAKNIDCPLRCSHLVCT